MPSNCYVFELLLLLKSDMSLLPKFVFTNMLVYFKNIQEIVLKREETMKELSWWLDLGTSEAWKKKNNHSRCLNNLKPFNWYFINTSTKYLDSINFLICCFYKYSFSEFPFQNKWRASKTSFTQFYELYILKFS